MWNHTTTMLVAELKTLKVWNLVTNKKEISVRCPFCGDSRKNIRSSHLYIKLDVRDDEPNTYYCQKCKTTGIVNSNLLKQLNIYNNELNIELGLRLKQVAKKNKKFRPIKREKILIPTPELNKRNMIKLNYINNRLSTNLTLEDLPKYKILLNLYDLLDENKVTEISHKNPNFVDTLDKNFIGFVSYDNNYAILRNLSKKVLSNMRYYNYNIFGNYDNTKRFYTIPTKIDLLKPKLNVVIAEGIFDILGIYFNIEKNPPENTLFISVNGVGYNLIFLHLAKMGFLDMDVKIYSDNDRPVSEFRDMKRKLKNILPGRVNIYYNSIEKDFGVPPEKIKLKRTFV